MLMALSKLSICATVLVLMLFLVVVVVVVVLVQLVVAVVAGSAVARTHATILRRRAKRASLATGHGKDKKQLRKSQH